MKKLITFCLAIFLLTACNNYRVYILYDKDYEYYNNKGKHAGYTEHQSPRLTRYYDKHGRYIGYSKQTSDGVRYYDSKGRLTVFSTP
jgi:hypothetical protein